MHHLSNSTVTALLSVLRKHTKTVSNETQTQNGKRTGDLQGEGFMYCRSISNKSTTAFETAENKVVVVTVIHPARKLPTILQRPEGKNSCSLKTNITELY
jgi:hypothetical protein